MCKMILKSNIPNRHLKLGVKIWPEMFRELWKGKELVWRLFLRNLSIKYKQTILGILWALILPFVAIGTFIFLNRAGIVEIESTDIPYPLFALIGLSVWQLFSVGIVSGTNSIVAAGSIITKINFPLEVLVFSSIAQSLFEFLIKVLLIIICFFIFGFIPSWCIVFFPFAVIPLVILTLGISLILSLINGILRDTANIVILLSVFMMFLTPVLYPITAKKFLVFKLNILSPLISAPRDLIIYGAIKEPFDYFIASILSLLVFFISWRIFHLVEAKIPERI